MAELLVYVRTGPEHGSIEAQRRALKRNRADDDYLFVRGSPTPEAPKPLKAVVEDGAFSDPDPGPPESSLLLRNRQSVPGRVTPATWRLLKSG